MDDRQVAAAPKREGDHSAPPTVAHDDWPDPPTGLTRAGFAVLILFGGGMVVAGAGAVALTVILGGAVLDRALAFAAIAIGAWVLLSSVRALDARQWQPLSRLPEGVWLAAAAAIWGVGIAARFAFSAGERWLLPATIVVGAWAITQLYLSATLHGLTAPAERSALSGRLLPRHIVLLSSSIGASLSTALALLLEGIALLSTIAIMVATTQVIGDQATLDLLSDISRDPDVLDRLEALLGRAPAALVGLGAILVFIAPAIEELVKALPLLLFARRHDHLGERTAILLGVAGGLGFAFTENVGYMGLFAEQWWLIFWFRAAAAAMHGAASGYVGRAWYYGLTRGAWSRLVRDACLGWGIHAFWNALALAMGWFAYHEIAIGVAFCIGFGLIPLAILFTIMARWGIWVSET
ncbi:MAG: PrsW family intramembrane metalloprotease [Anaerolineae bacterium]|nr:PrsW family intramembrane metalloprotease [Anaerolineae bacterium]